MCDQIQYNVEPFNLQFKDNDSIDFAFIDAYTNSEFFYDEMIALNITVGDYGNAPWVIFL